MDNAALLERLDEELLLRRYSPKTRRSYGGHVRRLLSTHAHDALTAEYIQSFLLARVDRGFSRSNQDQALSAVRFLARHILHRPELLVYKIFSTLRTGCGGRTGRQGSAIRWRGAARIPADR